MSRKQRWDYDAYLASGAPDPPLWFSGIVALLWLALAGWLARRVWRMGR